MWVGQIYHVQRYELFCMTAAGKGLIRDTDELAAHTQVPPGKRLACSKHNSAAQKCFLIDPQKREGRVNITVQLTSGTLDVCVEISYVISPYLK